MEKDDSPEVQNSSPPESPPIQEPKGISSKEPQTVNLNEDPENMEVHYHPRLHNKKGKIGEYFLEGLMIFIAVTLGFFAESLREHIADRAKEKEFILSMIEDAEADISNIEKVIDSNNTRILFLDSLIINCFHYGEPGFSDGGIYCSFIKCASHPDFISPTQRTLSQLKNAGNMRLIHNEEAANSIIQYDDFAKKITNQQEYYERFFNEMLDQAMQVLSFQYYPKSGNAYGSLQEDGFSTARLVSNDKTKIIELGNKAWLHQGVVSFYNVRLQEGRENAGKLIDTLKKEYKLE